MKKKLLKRTIYTSHLLLLFIISGCNSNYNKITYVTIEQITANGTLQTRGTYILDNGYLEISKEFKQNINLNTSPTKLLNETDRLLLAEMIKEDFPSETISTENPELLQSFNRKVKNGRVEIDSDNKKTYLIGKDYKKEFTWVADNQARLKDSFGVEYSFTTDSK
ncbi:MAG: hypothetical protein KIA10_09715 [Enterococcus faecium]|uniref:hypothetical protein n=1 Tax=Enterococcus faecium TaxID=1352 RepID=UPI000CF0D475|nr:hypothetical protein [Enterococcus faecium]EGP5631744.1 hypothetical protein [Enterococcus faecium]MBS6011945.1 hypothetical protein [Enterococcus faecium]PQC78405.1 hypothetical protein CUM69_13435 [Enterococcus faecium]